MTNPKPDTTTNSAGISNRPKQMGNLAHPEPVGDGELRELITITLASLMIRKNSNGGDYPNVGEIVEKIMPVVTKNRSALLQSIRAELPQKRNTWINKDTKNENNIRMKQELMKNLVYPEVK